MYSNDSLQFSFSEFLLPFDGKLEENNRWVQNESTHLISQVETYHHRLGTYPTSVHADKICRTKENWEWCKERGIRLSGPKLGRPLKKTTKTKNKSCKTKPLHVRYKLIVFLLKANSDKVKGASV